MQVSDAVQQFYHFIRACCVLVNVSDTKWLHPIVACFLSMIVSNSRGTMLCCTVLFMLVNSSDCAVVDHTLHAGLDDLLRVAQGIVVDDPDKLVHAAAQGHLNVVLEVVREHPNKVHAAFCDYLLEEIFYV